MKGRDVVNLRSQAHARRLLILLELSADTLVPDLLVPTKKPGAPRDSQDRHRVGRGEHGGAEAPVAFAAGNLDPSSPVLGELMSSLARAQDSTGMETRLSVLHKG